MSLRTAIYVRVSTDDQRDSGYSIDSQIRELTNYCKNKKYDIIDIYNDAGYSGKNMNRPNIQRLLNDIKRGCIDIVLAVKVDRLTRSNYDGQNLLKTLEKYNVQLELIYEQYDIDNPYGEMMFGMNLLFAQRERKEISARTKKCLEEAVKEGKYLTQCPLGYVRNELGHLEIDPVSSLVVKDIFELYASGMSMNAIALKFEEEKRYNKKNTRWREDKIKKILPLIQKPARYTGGELNSVVKNKENIDIRFAFCFPDTYEIGMSHLGMKILYSLINSKENYWCERVFAKIVGRRVHPHLFRESRATNIVVYEKKSAEVAQKLLGHNDVSTTKNHYIIRTDELDESDEAFI